MSNYKYCPETETVSNDECTMRVTQDMPEWENRELIEDIDFIVDNDDNVGYAIPIKDSFK